MLQNLKIIKKIKIKKSKKLQKWKSNNNHSLKNLQKRRKKKNKKRKWIQRRLPMLPQGIWKNKKKYFSSVTVSITLNLSTTILKILKNY